MAKTDFKTIDEYQSTFSGASLERMQAIRRLIHEVAPEAEEVISYQIPAFKIGKQFLIYYCAFDKHLSISHPWSQTLLQAFESEFQGLKVSKSVIQFPHVNELPLDLIKRIIQFRKKEIDDKPEPKKTTRPAK